MAQSNVAGTDAALFAASAANKGTLYPIQDASGALIFPFAADPGSGQGIIGIRLWNLDKYALQQEIAAGISVANQSVAANIMSWTCLPLFLGTYTCGSSPQAGIASGVVLATEGYANNIVTLNNRGYPQQVQLLGPQNNSGVIVPDGLKVGIKVDCIGHRFLEVLTAPDSSATAFTSTGAEVQFLTGGT
jgi:hypothetical protein